MSDSVKKSLREEYNRLKKAFEKILKPKREELKPQLIPVPIRQRRF